MVALLIRYNIKVTLVFDGRKLYAKEKTEELRKKVKEENQQKAEQF